MPASISNTDEGREKYMTPSPGWRQPGLNRNNLTGELTANILKALQGGCAKSGGSFCSYSGLNWGGVHLDHTTKKKTINANKLFRGKIVGEVLKEVRTLRAVDAKEHDHESGRGY
tara:strand:+ start:120 stop:464 length:345 start_codon:yes stop_codon:yes gene_type:complete